MVRLNIYIERGRGHEHINHSQTRTRSFLTISVTYGPKMEKLMKSILLVSEIAMLAEEIEFMVSNTKKKSTARGWLFQNYNNTRQAGGEDDGVGEDDEDEDDDEDNEYSNSRKYSDVYEFPGAAPSIDVDDDNDNDGDINNEMNNDTTTASARRDKEEQHISTNKSNIFPFHNPFKKDRNKTEIHSMIKKSNTRELEKLLGRWTEPEVYRKAQVRQGLCRYSIYLYCLSFDLRDFHFLLFFVVARYFNTQSASIPRISEILGR